MKLRIFGALLIVFYGVSANAALEEFETPQINTCAAWGTAPTGWTIESQTAALSDMTASPCTGINSDGALSGTQALINYNSRIGTLVNDSGPFDLNSFWVHGQIGIETTTVRFAGLNSVDSELFATSVVVDLNWQEVVVDWPGISKFTWDPTSPATTNISIDDLNFEDAEPDVAVPVPSMTTYGLILAILGLLLITGFRYRKSL